MSDTSTALAVRRAPLSGYNPPPSEDEFRGMIYMAKQLSEVQGFVPAHFFKQPNKILAAILYGRDLGITPTNALQHIIVIEGKATADAQLMGMLVRRAGHRMEDKTTAESSTVTITRADDGSVHSFTFTMQDAARAGLVRAGSGWQKYPQAMLYARALTGCARKGAQDALMGVAYTPEELGVEVVDGAFTGEIPSSQASPESLAAMAPGLSEVTTPSQESTTAIQPTAPAPSVGVPEPSGDAQASAVASAEVTAQVLQRPAMPVVPLAGANISRRLGPGRSISPVRRNVTTVQPPPAAETPATAPEWPEGATARAVAASSQPAPPALTDEPVLPVPEDPGKAVYLNQLRGDLRVQTAALFRVNVILDNVKRGLEGKEPNEIPLASPSEASDQALAARIDADFPGRTLTNLHQEALEGLVERFESNLTKKRAVLKERGISEE